jgi:hypothetical protein
MKGLQSDSGSAADGGDETRACAACGARPRRPEARFCATCGQNLCGGYFPTDSVRASYRFESAPAPERDRPRAKSQPVRRRVFARRAPSPSSRPRAGREFTMPRARESGAAEMAFAFVTYGLVPYLGILFCPGALVFGGVGLVRAWRAPQDARAARASALGVVLGLLVLCVQLLLWWLLYKVPEWARGAPF